MLKNIPKWHKELELFTKIKPLIILEGNVLDSYQYPTQDGGIMFMPRLPQYLNYFLKDSGYQNIIFYDNLRGFYNNFESGALENFGKIVRAEITDGVIKSKFSGTGRTAPNIIRDALTQNATSTAIVMDFASRYIVTPEHMEQPEIDSFTILLQASLETIKNLLVLIVNKVNDLPAWFYLQNPNVKIITMSTPSKGERENFVKGEDKFYHWILEAKDERGHEQLRELSTRAWLRAFEQGRMMRVPTYYSDLQEIIGKDKGHVIMQSACFRKDTKVLTKNGKKNI